MDRDKVITFMRARGPVQPIDVKRSLGSDTIVIGAILSELVSNSKLKITNVKRGGSPFYYLPEHSSQLAKLTEFLNGKDKETANLLQSKKVLEDKTQTPLVRVSLRNIKDFARPIEVTINNEKKLFWKWYTIPKEDVINEIKSRSAPKIFTTSKKKKKEQKKEIKRDVKVKKEKSVIKKKEVNVEKEKKENVTTQKTLEPKQTLEEPASDFIQDIRSYLKNSKIKILDETVIRKTSDVEYLVNVPSSIGEVQYFCKAKSKKRVTEGDISTAYIKAESKKLPLLFIVFGSVAKKALENSTNQFKNIKIIELD